MNAGQLCGLAPKFGAPSRRPTPSERVATHAESMWSSCRDAIGRDSPEVARWEKLPLHYSPDPVRCRLRQGRPSPSPGCWLGGRRPQRDLLVGRSIIRTVERVGGHDADHPRSGDAREVPGRGGQLQSQHRARVKRPTRGPARRDDRRPRVGARTATTELRANAAAPGARWRVQRGTSESWPAIWVSLLNVTVTDSMAASCNPRLEGVLARTVLLAAVS